MEKKKTILYVIKLTCVDNTLLLVVAGQLNKVLVKASAEPPSVALKLLGSATGCQEPVGQCHRTPYPTPHPQPHPTPSFHPSCQLLIC